MRRIWSTALPAAQLVVLLLGLVLLLGYFWVVRTFEHASIEMMFIYLNLPLTGVDKRFIFNFLLYVALAALVLVLIVMYLRRAVRAGKIPKVGLRALDVVIWVFAAGVLLLSIALWESKYGVYDYVFPDTNFYTYFEERADVVEAKEVVFGNKRRNLVLITLESLDSVMTDEAVFSPPIMPALRAMQRENQSFSGQRMANGTTGSISSYSSVMTGAPLIFRRPVLNDPEAEEERGFATIADIPEHHPLQTRSMPGILEQHGYRVQVVMGARCEFSGLDILMGLCCENVQYFDYTYFTETRADLDGRTNSWGANDGYVFERSKEILAATAAGDQPFAHLIQTVNTHVPGFYEPGMDREYGDIRDSFRQTDSMLSEYVAWIRAQPFGGNTTIVIMGDHVLPLGAISDIALSSDTPRGIVVVFLNSARADAPRGYQRFFGTWDMAPSIIEAVGGQLPRGMMGLGTSLFSDRETLFEKEGMDVYNEMIQKRSHLYNEMYRWLK